MTTSAPAGRFIGKYRATVVNNADPMLRGRLQLLVPDVYGPVPSTWAEACTPLAGPTGPPMGTHLVPPIGAGVWVEFEQGDPNYPVWVGCRWGAPSDLPPGSALGLPGDPAIVIQSLGQHALVISDAPPTPVTGGVVLQSATRATIVVNDSGIYIDNGKGASIALVGPTVTINNGALAVT
ncbi:phage baseplate assembly protein V [Sphingomonas sp.]|uniref:phage baseplate assembly protein V n=1 Tax=Sphingomonas sp. TaxID=28214 RepID=UPI0035BBEEDE